MEVLVIETENTRQIGVIGKVVSSVLHRLSIKSHGTSRSRDKQMIRHIGLKCKSDQGMEVQINVVVKATDCTKRV